MSHHCNEMRNSALRMTKIYPDSKDHGANMGSTWVLSAPGGPHVCPMNLAIRLPISPIGTATIIFSEVFTTHTPNTGCEGDPDSKIHVAHMGPTWVLSAPGGPHVGATNLAIGGVIGYFVTFQSLIYVLPLSFQCRRQCHVIPDVIITRTRLHST